MTSIITNTGAIVALNTLRGIDSDLYGTQRQVSSGYRVATAQDNAAYWSISTTMRSDAKVLSVVADSLGLGTATAQVAYTGMNAVIDVLSDFKAKLVAAKEPGVDRQKVQVELDQLKQQVLGITTSSTFSGENWLNTKVDDMEEEEGRTRSLISGYTGGEAPVLQTLDVDLSKTSLLNVSGKGILQSDDDAAMGTLGGLVPPPSGSGSWGVNYPFPGGVTFSPSDSIRFDLTLDSVNGSTGGTYPVTIDFDTINDALNRNDGLINSPFNFQTVMDAAFEAAGAPAFTASGGNIYNDIGYLRIWSAGVAGETANNVEISNVVSSLPAGNTLGLDQPPTSAWGENYASGSFAFREPFQLSEDDYLSFDLQINANAATSFTITQADVNAALGTVNGEVMSGEDMARVLESKLGSEGLHFGGATSSVSMSIDPALHPETGSHSRFAFSNVEGTLTSASFDFMDIDITGTSAIEMFIVGVDKMFKKAVTGASELGAIESRLSMQLDFTKNLGDFIDSGVGRLVDADMDEVSSRLKALQTQQQLANQSLSVANANPEAILSLFQ